MALLPSLLIVFDTTALVVGNTSEWQEFSRLGECYVPEGVLEQMELMCDRATEPEVERTAREFMRFYPTSGWKKTGIRAEHAALKPTPGHALSQRARLSLAVASGGYGLALRYPERLIVLIANDQALLQQVLGLSLKNLCGLPVPALLQWTRSQRRPPIINQHLQQMRTGQPAKASANHKPAPATALISNPGRSLNATRTATPEVRPGVYTAQRQRGKVRSRQLMSLFSSLVSLAMVLGVIATIWRFISPTSFAQLWNQLPFIGAPK